MKWYKTGWNDVTWYDIDNDSDNESANAGDNYDDKHQIIKIMTMIRIIMISRLVCQWKYYLRLW